MPHRFRNNPLEDSDDELPHAADELPEDDSGPASSAGNDDDVGFDSQDFLDERNSEEIEAEGAAALGAEPSEALLYSSSRDQPAAPGSVSTGSDEPCDTASTENGSGRAEEEVPEGCLDKEGQATVLATLESITERYTWPKLYLEFLLLSAIRDPSWRRAVLCQYPKEEDFVFQAAVKKVEGWLLDFRSQGTLSTWVSAHPALNSAMKLPDLTQHSPTSFCDSKRVQRCAVCYRDREYGIKLFSFEGHPMRKSAYVHDRTTGIAAPRTGERATSEARMADLFGWQQFGGSVQDTGSSSDDEDCPEQDWSARQWQTALPCDRYGTRTLRRQRRHDRKAGRQDGWAFEGLMPPAIREDLVAGSGGKWQRQQQQQEEEEEEEEEQEEEEVDDASQDGNSSSSSGSSSDEAPLSQRPWDKSGRTPAAAAAGNDREHRHQTRSATRTRQHPQQAHNANDYEPQQQAGGARGGEHRSSRRRSTRSRTRAGQSGHKTSQQQQQQQQEDEEEEDEEEEPMNSPVPAAAAAMVPPSCSRYNTRSSARKQQQAGVAARQHALSQLAAKAGRTAAKRLDFDAVREPAAAAAAGDDDMDIEATSSSSSDSGSDEETLAGRQRRRQNPAAAAAAAAGIDAGTAARHRVLRRKSATAAAAAAAAVDDAAAVDAVSELVDVVDLTDTTPRRQRRPRARRITLMEDDDEGDAAGAAMTQQPAPAAAAASSPAPMRSPPPAAAAAAAGGEDDDEAAELLFTPTSASKRTRQKARILSDDEEGGSKDDNAGQQQQQQQGVNQRASRASPAAAVGAGLLRSPHKRLRRAEAAAAPAGEQEQEDSHGQSQLEDADMQPADEQQSDMVDLISSDSAPNVEGQQREEGEEQEQEERGFRRRGFLVGGGVCSARLRLHHMLQHWPDKATKVLLSAYGWQDGRLTEKARVGRVMDRVAEDLVEQAFKGIEKAVRLLSGVTGNRLSETQQGRELLELVEEAERALDVEGRTTFRH